jgi:dsDNA-binding SOS-regulon protein
MVKRRRSKKERVVSKKKAKGARRMWSYSDLYEDWLQKQAVKSSETPPEVKIPTDTFEGWIQERVRRKLSQD